MCLSLSGICIPLNSTHYHCNCTEDRTGSQCADLIDYCHNVTCLNKGRCVSVHPTYKCQCISPSYSGHHCEQVASSVVVRQYVSKSFAFIAIIAISLVAGFILIMDILKYGFGIDPVREEREFLQRRHAASQQNSRALQSPSGTRHSPTDPIIKRSINRKY